MNVNYNNVNYNTDNSEFNINENETGYYNENGLWVDYSPSPSARKSATSATAVRPQRPTPMPVAGPDGKKPKRKDEHVMNVKGLFRPEMSNVNFDAHVKHLHAKYGANHPVLMNARRGQSKIDIARNLRAQGRAPRQRKEQATKITQKSPKKAKVEPGLCAEIESGKNPFMDPCWIDGIKQKMEPLLHNVEAGHWGCGKDQLGPHQVVHTEAAKLMATKAGQKLGPTDRRGILVYANTGSGKCHAYDTPILMHDGYIKKVQDVDVGDVVMGDDGGPRCVLSLGRGREAMYDIVPSKGETWGCNESHILVMKFIRHKKVTPAPRDTWTLHWHTGNGVFKTKSFKTKDDAEIAASDIDDSLELVQMELKDYLLLGSQIKHTLKMYRVGVEEFPDEQEPCFDPYVVGAWLGDGTSRSGQITTAEIEIVSELHRRLEPHGMYIKAVAQKYQFSMTGDSRALIKALRKYDMIQNKHIPHHIKTGSRKTRLEVLAGLLDTDGYYHDNINTYEITQKNKRLADDIVFVARSLGFLATIREVEKSCTYKGEKKTGTYHRIHISGAGLENIPVVLDRKRAHPREQIKNALHYGFKVVPTGWGDYYGFTIDANHRYLLGDFTVTHNTVSATGIMAAFWATGLKIFFVTSNENSKNNPLTEYAKNALIFFPKYANVMFSSCSYMPPEKFWNTVAYKDETKTFPGPDGKPRSFKQWCVDEGQQVISKKLVGGKILSFWVFAGAGKADRIDRLKSEGGVLIIDESQNMYKPRSTGAESEALGYMAKHLPTEPFMKNSYIFPLTATPGDTADQVIKMVNVVRPWGMPTITPQAFVANPGIIRGLVSYADIRGDQTHYGKLDSGKAINKFVPLESRYFAALVAEMKSFKEERDLDENPDASKKFFVKSIAASCILGAKKVQALYKGDEGAFENLLSATINSRTQVVFSSKMEAIFKSIEATEGCQYLYVPDPNVLKATVDVLSKKLGYERIDATKKYLKKEGKGWKLHLNNEGHKRRFYAFYPGTMDGVPGDADQMKSVLDFFKGQSNKHGEHIKLFVGTVFEGLDMGWLQAVHLAAPLPSTADDDQAVGRALRYCGHDPSSKIVKVYRWFGTAPKTLEINAKPAKQAAIDQGLEMLADADQRGVNVHVYRDALRRGKPMREFMMCIRGQAIECEANTEHGGILAALQYGEKTKCHIQKCNVQLDKEGNLVVDEHVPGKHGNTNMNQKLVKGKKQQGSGGGMLGGLFGPRKSPGTKTFGKTLPGTKTFGKTSPGTPKKIQGKLIGATPYRPPVGVLGGHQTPGVRHTNNRHQQTRVVHQTPGVAHHTNNRHTKQHQQTRVVHQTPGVAHHTNGQQHTQKHSPVAVGVLSTSHPVQKSFFTRLFGSS